MKKLFYYWLVVTVVALAQVTTVSADTRREIRIPDILGYKTLKCDFHMHTVFSDGNVWPPVRVDEAWREGLDAIAITDHIEYQPHKDDVPTNFNRSYELALGRAKQKHILIVKAAEITRDTPPGHFNALFLKDITPLATEKFLDAIEAANKQNAFVFWNHPGWKPKAEGWFDIHTTLYKNKWLHGIEPVNGASYYPKAHQWGIEKNLTLLGNSDIHAPSLRLQSTTEDHRSMTLVFAKEKTLSALKQALFERRTAIWFKDQLIGPQKYLQAIFNAAVYINPPHLRQGKTVWLHIENRSDLDIQISGNHLQLTLPANKTILFKTQADPKAETLQLPCQVTNFLIAPSEPLPVTLTIKLRAASAGPSKKTNN